MSNRISEFTTGNENLLKVELWNDRTILIHFPHCDCVEEIQYEDEIEAFDAYRHLKRFMKAEGMN